MTTLRVGNAPCSCGTLEFKEAKGVQIEYRVMLDELVEAGYTGTELGEWGYMPTDPEVLSAELRKRRLVMLGAFVPVALKDRSAHNAGLTLYWQTTTATFPNEPPMPEGSPRNWG